MLQKLFCDPVIVEEKVDGSQFSFGVFNGELKCRSKGAVLNITAPEKLFVQAVETAKRLAPLLVDGWTCRGEYLARPKHNTLAYERIPPQHVIGFDINTGHEIYLPYELKQQEFARLGLETVPCLFMGVLEDHATCRELLERTSVLGGQKIEGVVIKNTFQFGPDGKVLMGKFVSEAFKEVHSGEWRDRNPTGKDVIQTLIDEYKTPARWAKSVQRLREAGKLEDSPRDIGMLIKEVADDVEAECAAEIREKLFDWAWGNIRRGISSGLPGWYKEELLKRQFEESTVLDENL